MDRHKTSVVIAEDEYLIAMDIAEAARQVGYDVVGLAADGEKALELIEKHSPTAAILDIQMPRMTGIEAAKRIRDRFDIPVIIMTAYESQELFDSAKEAGVAAYLVKPPNVATLRRAVELALTSHEEKKKLKELVQNANIDPLTGLNNRRTFQDAYSTELQRVRRYGDKLPCVAIMDLDHFKAVNDNHGHDVGDEVLRRFAQTLQKSLRSVDVAGRWGGEEFAVLLPETQLKNALPLLNRIRTTVGELRFAAAEGEFSVTVSIGVAAATTDQTSLEQILKNADQALYDAKNSGRDKVCGYDTAEKKMG